MRLPALFASALFASALFASTLFASTPQTWEMSTFTDFLKGKFDGVSLGRDGRLSLAPKMDTLFASEQPVIWSVAAGSDGSLYAATGHRGRVFKIDASGKSSLVWTADRPEVFAVAAGKNGVIYAASSPDGKIFRIENGKATEYFDPKTKYIWALAVGADGTLYAGTGDGGRVFRVTGPGRGEEYYATGQGNVTGLTIDLQGRLLAGTEPNGLLYRITAKDKAFVLYDANLPEIRAVAPQPDGSVIAVALGGALAKKVTAAQAAAAGAAVGTPTFSTSITVTADSGGELKPAPPAPKTPQQQAMEAAAIAAASAPQQTAVTSGVIDLTQIEKSAIYRINADNTVETLWSSKEENVYDILTGTDGDIYFGTDASGRIYRLGRDRKLTLVAQTNEAEATRLLRWNGTLLAATGNMGKIYRLGASSLKGAYESPVFDAGGVAQWGKFRWSGDKGAGTVAFHVRTGNSIRPDKTWSEWSEAFTSASGTQIPSPNARYIQFNTEMTGTGAVIDSVSASYLPQNQPPVVRSVTVLTTPATAVQQAKQQANANTSAASSPYSITVTDSGDAGPVTSTGTPTQTLSRASAQQLMISWQADDPDQDRLIYKLEFRGEDERDWKLLRANVRENSLTIDGDVLADGKYWFRVTASDREVNAPKAAREADLTSSPVLIDNTPPMVRVQSNQRSGTGVDVAFEALDNASAIKRAEYSIDAGPWVAIAPVDGILDSMREEFQLRLESVPAGEHVVVIRVADSGNNVGLAKVILR